MKKLNSIFPYWILTLGLFGGDVLALAPRPVAPSLVFGEVGYGGTGCPAGTLEVSWIKDPILKVESLEVQASQWNVQVGNLGRLLDRKNCQLSIPAQIPNGYRVKLSKAEWAGSLDLESSSELSLHSEYFSAGEESNSTSRLISGPHHGRLDWNDSVPSSGVWMTRCSPGRVNLRIALSMVLKSDQGEESRAQLQRLYFGPFKLEPCTQ